MDTPDIQQRLAAHAKLMAEAMAAEAEAHKYAAQCIALLEAGNKKAASAARKKALEWLARERELQKQMRQLEP